MSEDPSTLTLESSPAFHSRGSAEDWAYEIKFLLDEELAAEVEWQLIHRMQLDAHADPQLDHCYPIQTLYFDTSDRDVFYRRGNHRHRKLRIRRYGAQNQLVLELKQRHGRRVAKHRSRISLSDFSRLSAPTIEPHWNGGEFHAELRESLLAPVCQLHYLRRAYTGEEETGSVRLTFDRHVRGSLHSHWELPEPHQPLTPLLPGQAICEMKFQHALPRTFKGVMEQFALIPEGCSKYRRCLQQLQDVPQSGVECA